MSRSDRSLVVAAIFGLVTISGGIGATLAGTWTSPPSYESEQDKASAERRYAQAVTRKGEVAAANYAPYPSKQANKCYNAENHDSADLCAQWRAAIAAEKAAETAWWSMWWVIIGTSLSGVGLVALIYTLRQTERSLNAAHQANTIAEKNGRLQLRAYLSPENILTTVRTFKGIDYCDLRVVWKNFGSTPTRNLVFSQVGLWDNVPNKIKIVFAEDSIRNLVGPGSTLWSPAIALTMQEADDIWSEKRRFFIAGYGEYSDILGDESHYTEHLWEIFLSRENGKPLEGNNIQGASWAVVGGFNSAT